MQVIPRFKLMFFDNAKVINAVDRASRSVLSKFGAFVRTAAKSSIRPRKKSSKPGHPPTSHSGLLKKFIFFGYSQQQTSVVIGPAKLNQKIGNAPEVLEYGGKSTIFAWDSKAKVKTKQTVRIAARPYMRPAFAKNLPKLPALWRNSVRAT